jgi:hypothetical protein
VLQIWQRHETKTLGRSLHDQLFIGTTFDNVVYMSSDIKLNMVIEKTDYWRPSPWMLSQQFLRWNYVEVWQSSQTWNNFSYLERTTKGCVKAQMQKPISCYGDTNEISFLFLPHHAKWISYKACTPHHAWALTICVVLHEFQSLRVCLEPLLQISKAYRRPT